jgi:phosphatidate cytidylyltransferase
MSLFYWVISIHFMLGAFGIILSNRKLPPAGKRKNWIKYSVYLLIFLVIMTAISVDRNAFLACVILIASVGIIELLKLNKETNDDVSINRKVFVSIAIYSLIITGFSLFILLPLKWITYTYTLVILFDGASQITGQIARSRKLLPKLSPNKTWGGLIGGYISACVTALILHKFVDFTLFQSILFGLVICTASFVGDMSASALKRSFNVKDFGNILPGQGGVLDRFDSFLTSGAVIGCIALPVYFLDHEIDRDIAVYLGYTIIFMAILLFGELLQSVFKLRTEYSRIFSHIMVGLVSLPMLNLFTLHGYIVFLCLQSAGFIFITKKMGLLSSHHNVERNTNGSSFFFLGILAAYIISEIKGESSFFILSIAVLSISDPLAALIGLKFKSGQWPILFSELKSSKTYIGTFGFFISTFFILIAGISFFYTIPTWQIITISLVISVLTSLAELVSSKGTDNIMIPFMVSITLALIVTI